MTDDPRARAARALAEHAPEHRGADLRPLGAGLDHAAFVVGDLVVRVAGTAGATREAALLALVARHVSVPVPAPRFADPERGVLAYPLLPGRPLLGRDPPRDAAERLGRFLAELHGIARAEIGDLAPVERAEPDAWLDDLDGPPHLLDVRTPTGRSRPDTSCSPTPTSGRSTSSNTEDA